MPEMNGGEFLGKVREMYPDVVRMMLSGYTDLKAVTTAVNRGELFAFLTKPWDDTELMETVRDAFRHSEQRQDRRRAQRDGH
jgi:FixJ family two-component response regulator